MANSVPIDISDDVYTACMLKAIELRDGNNEAVVFVACKNIRLDFLRKRVTDLARKEANLEIIRNNVHGHDGEGDDLELDDFGAVCVSYNTFSIKQKNLLLQIVNQIYDGGIVTITAAAEMMNITHQSAGRMISRIRALVEKVNRKECTDALLDLYSLRDLFKNLRKDVRKRV
jgi:hypothetical protein